MLCQVVQMCPCLIAFFVFFHGSVWPKNDVPVMEYHGMHELLWHISAAIESWTKILEPFSPCSLYLCILSVMNYDKEKIQFMQREGLKLKNGDIYFMLVGVYIIYRT